MASGSFNIETFSWYRSLPLSNDTTPYSTATMFAVGPSSFLEPYSFYQYQSTSGFTDTSTLSIQFSNYVCTSLQSTTLAIQSNIDFIGKIYISTVPLTKWVSPDITKFNPFPYPSTFFDSNASSFISSAEAIGTPTDFRAIFSEFNRTYPDVCVMSTLWLGEGLTNLINTKQFNVFVDSQYSIYVSTPYDRVTWISTIGVFNDLGQAAQNIGRTTTTRIGNLSYIQVNNKQVFTPQPGGFMPEIPVDTSNFHLEIVLQSNAALSNLSPAYDIFIPGENNFTFTLVPVLSTITLL